MTRSFTYALAFVLVIWMSLALPGVARELAQDGKCTPDTLRPDTVDDENKYVRGCPAPDSAPPGKAPGGQGPPALVPVACVELSQYAGLNFIPNYPPHWCPKLCPLGTTPCCVWDTINGGHTCRCYTRGCPIKWTPRGTDIPL